MSRIKAKKEISQEDVRWFSGAACISSVMLLDHPLRKVVWLWNWTFKAFSMLAKSNTVKASRALRFNDTWIAEEYDHHCTAHHWPVQLESLVNTDYVWWSLYKMMNNKTVMSFSISETSVMTVKWPKYEFVMKWLLFYQCVLLGYLLKRLVVENQLEITMTREWQLRSVVEIAVGISAGVPPRWLNAVCDSSWQEAFWGRAFEMLTFSFWWRSRCVCVVCLCAVLTGFERSCFWYTPSHELEARADHGWTFQSVWCRAETGLFFHLYNQSFLKAPEVLKFFYFYFMFLGFFFL